MIDYLKNLDSEKLIEKLKPLMVSAICLIAVFAAGFGVGKSSIGYGGASPRSLNYTTQEKEEQKPPTNNTNKTSQTSKAATTNTAQIDPNNCYIKGSKSKTYHIPGGAFYERTTPAACFESEEEAQSAGYKKSSR